MAAAAVQLVVLGQRGDNPLAYWEEIDWDMPEDAAPSPADATSYDKDSALMSFEDEVKANPFSVKLWILYLEAAKNASPALRFNIFERAVHYLPRSYKLWYRYLQERVAHAAGEPVTAKVHSITNNAFERCLVNLSQMPGIWLSYMEYLQEQPVITKSRRCCDRALQSLPITQHYRIWASYISLVDRVKVPELSVAVYKRYLMIEPSKVGSYIDLLKDLGRIDEAACVLAKTLNDDNIYVEGKTPHQLWSELCDLIAAHPTEIKSVDVENILRSGLRKFTAEVALLWCGLANHYILLGQMEKARDVFEEALSTVATTHDFGTIFDTYAKFMETLVSQVMKNERTDPTEIDLLLARLDDLIQRRPLLLSSVKLRQNPNNVIEWFNRIKLFKENPIKVVKIYTEALLTVDPFQAIGRITELWVQFARFYEKHDDLPNVRSVYERGVAAKFRSPEDLASLWCSWVETELRHREYKQALQVARRAIHKPTSVPLTDNNDKGLYQRAMARNVRLWSLCLDLEESLGTPATLKAAVEKMFDLKVITPAQLLNYTKYLEEQKYWEESFRMYERAVALFRWPYVYDVWLMYLSKFVSRYGGTKLERARELFEQALVDAPPHLSKRLFLLFGKLEEEFGLAKHAIAVYDRAAETVDDPDQVFEFYSLLIAKTAEFFGTTRTRPIFERAIEKLAANDTSAPLALKFGLRFCDMERNLGEIDRARAVLQHASQFADPKEHPEFWQHWRDFEVAHGNEDLFRDMLRLKRSVQAVYSQDSVLSKI